MTSKLYCIVFAIGFPDLKGITTYCRKGSPNYATLVVSFSQVSHCSEDSMTRLYGSSCTRTVLTVVNYTGYCAVLTVVNYTG
jgi:hypothetical protein